MCVCIYTHIHTYIHTYIHTCIYIYIYTHHIQTLPCGVGWPDRQDAENTGVQIASQAAGNLLATTASKRDFGRTALPRPGKLLPHHEPDEGTLQSQNVDGALATSAALWGGSLHCHCLLILPRLVVQGCSLSRETSGRKVSAWPLQTRRLAANSKQTQAQNLQTNPKRANFSQGRGMKPRQTMVFCNTLSSCKPGAWSRASLRTQYSFN